jgi:hypothetical protein
MRNRVFTRGGPQILPHRNIGAVTPAVIPTDVHQSDEAAGPATRDGKCATKKRAFELLVVILVGNVPPVPPVRRRLDEPQ